jgi:uncharacterized membrane protein YfcA
MIGQLSNPWFFVVLGIGAGIISGTLGLGSGTIVIPALVLLFGFGQKNAQGTALAVMVPMALVGAIRYWRNPEIEMNALPVGLIICGALVGVLVGTELAFRLPEHILIKVFAIFLIIVAVRMFTCSSKSLKSDADNSLGNPKNIELIEPRGVNDETGK